MMRRATDQLKPLSKQYWERNHVYDPLGIKATTRPYDDCIGRWVFPFGGDTIDEMLNETDKCVDSDCERRSMSVWIVYTPEYSLYTFPTPKMLRDELRKDIDRNLFIFGL